MLDSNIPEYFLPAERGQVATFLDELAENGVRFLVVEENDEIVACGGVRIDANDDARMCWGMVRRDLHRHGFGRLLLAARLLEGAKMGAKTGSLGTIPPVEGFFAKLGFTFVGSEKDRYGPGWDGRDYRITLDPPTLARLESLLS